MDLGAPSKRCSKCKALMWNEERNNKSEKKAHQLFHYIARMDRQNIRIYNSLFQFTSIGGKIDRRINNGGGPYCFQLNGQNYHLIGSLKPLDGVNPKFSQLYVYDTENEIQNRLNVVPSSNVVDPDIVDGLLKMLDEKNKLAEGFRYARDRLNLSETDDFSLLLVSSKSASGRPNQVGPSNEVAVLIVGDNDDTCPFRDIVVQTKERFLKRVFEICKHYMQLQYPLLFPYGDDGFHLNIPLHNKKQKDDIHVNLDQRPDEVTHRSTVIMRGYYAYKLMKHGLPHCHMLIWLDSRDRPKNVYDIDKLISADIQDEKDDPIGFHVVRKHMIHGPCGKDFTYSPCMVKGNCGRHFPKRYNANTFFDDCRFPVYRRRRTGRCVVKKGIKLENQFVVPYNRDLLIRFKCHINLEVCNSSRSLKYLFKYCLKGYDTTTMILRRKQQVSGASTYTLKPKFVDEIKNFLDGRYICALEAAWLLLGFNIHHRFPTVERLPVHCEGEKNVSFKHNDNLKNVAQKAKIRHSKLEACFEANKTFTEAM
ncbi:uncharacterized protein LOC141705466 [Apium graveolens]|uniref:uncharacterized protein LOC141705466 n=1 Tax=Apium graveolens TaxID=4045 RepID=UPI003D7A14D6